MSGAKKAPIDTRAADALTNASRDDYNWMTTTFAPQLDSLRGFSEGQVDVAMRDPRNQGLSRDAVAQQVIKGNEQAQFGRGVREAGITAEANMLGAQRASDRAQRRMGLAADAPDVAFARQRARAFKMAEGRASAENTMRRGFRDMSVARAQAGAKLGATIKGLGVENLGTAASAAAARNSQNAQMTKGGAVGALGGAFNGVMSGLAMGNPFAAIAGGVVGGIQGAN